MRPAALAIGNCAATPPAIHCSQTSVYPRQALDAVAWLHAPHRFPRGRQVLACKKAPQPTNNGSGQVCAHCEGLPHATGAAGGLREPRYPRLRTVPVATPSAEPPPHCWLPSAAHGAGCRLHCRSRRRTSHPCMHCNWKGTVLALQGRPTRAAPRTAWCGPAARPAAAGPLRSGRNAAHVRCILRHAHKTFAAPVLDQPARGANQHQLRPQTAAGRGGAGRGAAAAQALQRHPFRRRGAQAIRMKQLHYKAARDPGAGLPQRACDSAQGAEPSAEAVARGRHAPRRLRPVFLGRPSVASGGACRVLVGLGQIWRLCVRRHGVDCCITSTVAP
jgi:hypothetical protein